MRILFTIPHFFNPEGDGKHASLRKDPHPRITALINNLNAIRALYSQSQCIIDVGKRLALPANHQEQTQVDIVICITQNFHILNHLNLPPQFFMYHSCNVEPMLLGFECQAVLRALLGKYDYYCYLEDDLMLQDPWFFVKLKWFNFHGGNGNVLQPNRYEVSPQGQFRKVYVDGDLLPQLTQPFQNVNEQPQLMGKVMEQNIVFNRALNPHSGCYFLNAEQMEYWAKQPHFLDRDTQFIGPLESAATLGILKTFKIYKPAPVNASFLEIQHHGTGFLTLIGNQVTVSDELKK